MHWYDYFILLLFKKFDNFLTSGLRFGLLQSKVGLATILKNYKIKLSQKTKLPLTMDKQALVTTTDGGICIEAEKIN
jgi:cytochrome P450 family 6